VRHCNQAKVLLVHELFNLSIRPQAMFDELAVFKRIRNEYRLSGHEQRPQAVESVRSRMRADYRNYLLSQCAKASRFNATI
jgi:hypothetical protein